MQNRSITTGDRCRVALGVIRIVNGVLALASPGFLLRRLGADDAGHPASRYALRMFGIRTILIGSDLLNSDEAIRGHALDAAIVVHACDTASAVTAGLRGDLPRRGAIMATGISALNVVLSVQARRSRSATG
jgi:hypothetical protein